MTFFYKRCDDRFKKVNKRKIVVTLTAIIKRYTENKKSMKFFCKRCDDRFSKQRK